MTKIKYLVLCLATIVLAVVFCISCNDEQENKKESTEVTKKIAPRSDLRVFHWEAGEPRCSGHNGNCLDDVVIVAERPRQMLTEFYQAVNSNNYLLFVRNNLSELSQYFETDVLNSVINSQLEIDCNWNNQLFFIFTDVNTQRVVRAYPFDIRR